VNELETRLRALGAEVDYPATPDLLGAVGGRLATRPRRRRGLRLAVALAALAAALGAILAASPGARSAFLELFHLSGATIARVDELPPAQALPDWAPGTAMPLADAQRRVGYRIRLPRTTDEGPVPEVLLDEQGGGVVSLVWCCNPTIVLTQFAGESIPYLQKLVSPGTTIQNVEVGGKPGYWLAGGSHVVLFRAADGTFHQHEVRVAGNVLLWVDGEVTLRLEGRLTRDEALELAATVR
jgi:hypothetical protein